MRSSGPLGHNDPVNRLATFLLLAAVPVASTQDLEAPRVDGWIEALGSPDWEEREEASRAIRDFGPAAIPLLEERLGGIEDLEVEERLRLLLSDLRYPDLVGLWVGEIDGQPFTVIISRQEGRQALGANTCHWKSGPLTCGLESIDSGRDGEVFLDEPRDHPGAGRYVCRVDPEADSMSGVWAYYRVEQSYSWDLKRVTRSATAEDLEGWLASDRIGTRCSAVHCIALLDPATARPLLEKAAGDPDEVVRNEARTKLAELDRDRALGKD